MNEKLTFKELAEAVAAATKWSKTLTHVFIREMFAVIAEGLEKDGEVKIKGLGWFKLRWVEPRMGRHPQTGVPLLIPGYRRVLFRPEKSLRDLVNRRYAHLKPIFLKEETSPISIQQLSPTLQPEENLEKPSSKDANVIERINRSIRRKWLTVALVLVIAVALGLLLYNLRPKMASQAVSTTTTAAGIEPQPAISPPLMQDSLKTQPVKSDKSYQVRPGDTLWDMAGDFYDEHSFWPLIYRSNRTLLSDPDVLMPQQTLILAALQGSRLNLTRTDSAHLCEGYHLVYLAYKEKNKPGAEDYERAAARFR